MIERESGQHVGVAVPPSIEHLFATLQRSITLDRPGVSIDESVTTQEFEWMAQELLGECMDLDADQVIALAKAVAHNAYINPGYVGASVKQAGGYLSRVSALLALHPATQLELEVREELLADAHWYHKTIADAYERMKPDFIAGKANQEFVRRVVGAAAIHLEYLEMPHFIQDNLQERANNMLIGATALHGARYISAGGYRKMTHKIIDAQEKALRGKPADVLLLPPEASTW